MSEDILKALREAGFEPEMQEDTGFEPINGKYVCRIDNAGRLSGISDRTGQEYDFRSINLQVAEIISGDKATNRYLRLTYNMTEEGTKRLLNDLFTAGIEVNAETDTDLDDFLVTIKDKTMNIRAWAWTPIKDRDGNVIPEEDRKVRQQVRVIKEFTGKNKPSEIKSEVPF